MVGVTVRGHCHHSGEIAVRVGFGVVGWGNEWGWDYVNYSA